MRFAIYGFFFNKPFCFNDFYFSPIQIDLSFWEKVKLSTDTYRYNLTGYIDTPEIDSQDFIFTMQAVLTFVQQQDVIITEIFDDDIQSEYFSGFERIGFGAPFGMYSDLQQEIIEKLYFKLLDKTDLCNQKNNNSSLALKNNCEFSSLVYKVIEPFHMRKKFIEISYYLYFSGLEAFCKQYLKLYYPEINVVKDISKNLSEMLEKLGINYIHICSKDTKNNLRNKINDKDKFLKLSLSTYSNLRNSLFHQNLFVAEVPCSIKENDTELVKITDYEDTLLRLCNVVILKYIGIENPNLDCSKWYTRFPLIK